VENRKRGEKDKKEKSTLASSTDAPILRLAHDPPPSHSQKSTSLLSSESLCENQKIFLKEEK